MSRNQEQVSHGKPYLEADRHDGLTHGVPAEQAQASQERRAGGNGIAKGSKLIPSMGGRAHKGKTKLTHDVPDRKSVV